MTGGTSAPVETINPEATSGCAPIIQAAYDFAFKYSITTAPSCEEANMDGILIRKHAAKMMVSYVMNVL